LKIEKLPADLATPAILASFFQFSIFNFQFNPEKNMKNA